MIFQSCGSWWPWDGHRHVPLLTTQVSLWLHLCFLGSCLSSRLGTNPLSVCPGWLCAAPPHLTDPSPVPARVDVTWMCPHWPGCGHHSWDRGCTALAHSRAHQLGPFHLSGAGLRVAAPAELHAGKLTRASPSSRPCPGCPRGIPDETIPPTLFILATQTRD